MLIRFDEDRQKPDLIEWCDEIFGRVVANQNLEEIYKHTRKIEANQGVGLNQKSAHLSEQQIEVINAMYEDDCKNVIKGYRRCGLTTMMLLVAAYKIIFDGKRDILYVSSSGQACKAASDLLLKILHASYQYVILLSSTNFIFLFDVLGEHKTISFVPESRHDDVLAHNYTDAFFDNAAFYKDEEWMINIGIMWHYAGINIGSSPNGKDKLFWPLFDEAVRGKNNFNVLTLQWFLENRFNAGLRFTNKEGEVVKNIKPTKGNICEFLSRGYGITSDQREFMAQYIPQENIATEIDGKFLDFD